MLALVLICVAVSAAFVLLFILEIAPGRNQLVAQRLSAHPHVAAVRYPGLPGGDPQGLVGRQLKGPGALLAFEVKGGYAAAARVLSGVRLFTSAVSLGSCDSLIQHPAGLTHRVVQEDARASSGIGASLLRLSIGLEDPEDLWADLAQALDAAHAQPLRVAG